MKIASKFLCWVGPKSLGKLTDHINAALQIFADKVQKHIYNDGCTLRWVSSTPFRVPFHVLVRFRNRGIISITICKWSVQKTFQQHFSIISKSVCYDFYLKRNVAFTLISFDVLKWDDCLSVELPFDLPVQIPVQLLLELELNWLVQNVVELEFELSRM